ncbi:MAG TPA: Trm112 family protein [Acidimicrobiales bacterium]|nr:Trm112 family protein [Acidimicrobiales bacterium]
MSLDPFLLNLLRDPIDKEPLLYVETDSILYNPRRRVAYEVRGAIPVLLDTEARPVDDAEHERLSAPGAGTWTGS